MRKFIMILMLCLVPSLSFAQAAPSITVTAPKIEAHGITTKQIAIVVGAVVVGAILGDVIIGEAVGTMVGMLAGYIVGSHVLEELDDDEL